MATVVVFSAAVCLSCVVSGFRRAGYELYCTVCMFMNCTNLVTIETQMLVCGNKMPTRCNRGFYCKSYCLLNMFRASLCPSSGAQEYYTVVAGCGILCCGFSSSWSGVELRVMRPVCRMRSTGSNHCIILLSS